MNGKLEAVEKINAAYHCGRRVALLFDYDGTLVPIVDHPSLAVLPRRVRDMLEELALQPRLSVGILSGRKLEELKAMVGLPRIYYAGAAGLELDLQGKILSPSNAAGGRQLVKGILKPLTDLAKNFPGAWVEDKDLALTVHYRDVEPRWVPLLESALAALLQPVHGRLTSLAGPMAVEITPELGWTKGTALCRIVDHIGPTTLPVFAGDASNDEDALVAALALGGVALWVGPGPCPLTTYHLHDPTDLADFLALLMNQLSHWN